MKKWIVTIILAVLFLLSGSMNVYFLMGVQPNVLAENETLSTELSTLQTRITELQSDIDSYAPIMATLETENKEKQSAVEDCKKQLEQQDSERTALLAQQQEVEMLTEVLREEYDLLFAEYENLLAKKSSTKSSGGSSTTTEPSGGTTSTPPASSPNDYAPATEEGIAAAFANVPVPEGWSGNAGGGLDAGESLGYADDYTITMP